MDNNDKKMEKPDKKQSFAEYVTGKGFYRVVGICLAVVALSAWFITAALNENAEPEQGGLTSSHASVSGFVSSQSYESGLSSQLLEASGSSRPTASSQGAAAPDNSTSETAQTSASVAETSVANPAPSTGGRMLFIMPVSGEILRDYSDGLPVFSPTFGDWRTHNAIDIKGELGTSVRACCSGVVTAIRTDLIWGTVVEITHDNGYVSKYCGLGSKPTVKQDSVVETGQVIGSVGNTAQGESQDEPHLHFAVTKDGVSVNPLNLISTAD